jgi:hypothetical protein
MERSGVMPRETVHDVIDMWDIQIGWSPETVQLGVTARGDKTIAELLENPEKYNGLWSNLDRQAINRLIRVLRKARDGAFGADA